MLYSFDSINVSVLTWIEMSCNHCKGYLNQLYIKINFHKQPNKFQFAKETLLHLNFIVKQNKSSKTQQACNLVPYCWKAFKKEMYTILISYQ